MRHGLLRVAAYAWASPWSLLGLGLGLLAIATGGGVLWKRGILEFYGGPLSWLLRQVPIHEGAAAMTLGHTVIGRSRADLDRCREHERVHVRQYERWGPLFVPAYFVASAIVWVRGDDPYRDNPFEREAYGVDDESCKRD